MVRKESLKSLLAIGSFIITANAIGNALGGETKGANVGGVNILNPFDIKNITNSDFGKIKFGNVRLDPGGGYNQYIVAAMRFLSGLSTSPTTNVTRRLGEDYGAPTRLSQLIGIGGREKSFMENKFSPMASFIDTFLTGVDYQGRPTNIPAEVRDRFVPIMAQDLIDIYQEDPKLLPLAIPMTLGMGGQAFEPRIRRGRGMNMMRMPGFGMGLGM